MNCVYTYKGVNYSYAEFAAALHGGLLEQVVETGAVVETADTGVGAEEVMVKKADIERRRQEELKKLYPILEADTFLKDLSSVLQDYNIDKEFEFITPIFKNNNVKVSFDGKHVGGLPKVASMDTGVINRKLSNILTINKLTFDKLSKKQKIEVIAHEFIHGLIKLKLNEKGDLKGTSFYNGLNNIFKEVKDFYYSGEKQINKNNFDFLKNNFTQQELNDLGGKIRYIESSIEEFATLGLTDPIVSKFLKSLQGKGEAKKENLWTKLSKLISDFIGISNTKFNELLNFISSELDTDINYTDKINAKYDAELANLEQSTTTTIKAKKADIERRRQEELRQNLSKTDFAVSLFPAFARSNMSQGGGAYMEVNFGKNIVFRLDTYLTPSSLNGQYPSITDGTAQLHGEMSDGTKISVPWNQLKDFLNSIKAVNTKGEIAYEFDTKKINAKYDAELAALEEVIANPDETTVEVRIEPDEQTTKNEQDATKITSAESVDVGEPSRNGEKVGEGNAQKEEVAEAQEEKEVVSPTEQVEQPAEFEEVKQAKEKFYKHTEDKGYVEVKRAKPVYIFGTEKAFYVKEGKEFVVSDAITGAEIGRGSTLNNAVASAEENAGSVQNLESARERFTDAYGKSPYAKLQEEFSFTQSIINNAMDAAEDGIQDMTLDDMEDKGIIKRDCE